MDLTRRGFVKGLAGAISGIMGVRALVKEVPAAPTRQPSPEPFDYTSTLPQRHSAGQVWSVNGQGAYLHSELLSRQMREAAQPMFKFRRFSEIKGG